eukprot:8180230-Pyramimonas_sp.AAC.1
MALECIWSMFLHFADCTSVSLGYSEVSHTALAYLWNSLKFLKWRWIVILNMFGYVWSIAEIFWEREKSAGAFSEHDEALGTSGEYFESA